MKSRIFAVGLLVAASLAGSATARAGSADVQLATHDMRQMLEAIAHANYNQFVQPTTNTFRSHVDRAKFPKQVAIIDSKIPLAQPFSLRFLTTQRVGQSVNYIFEVTLHGGDQILTALSLENGRVASFHLL